MKITHLVFYLILTILTLHFPTFANASQFYFPNYRNTSQPIQPHPIFDKFPEVPPQNYDEEYFEWIDLLEAVENTEGAFNMLEVGAGYGRWSVRGGLAARSKNLPFFLTLIEAEPHRCHVDIHEEMKKYGINSHEYFVIPAAVGKNESSIFFYIMSSDDTMNLDNWYGQSVMFPHDRIIGWAKETYYGQPIAFTACNYKAVKIEQLRLSTILNQVDAPIIDLCDFDIQGNEYDAIAEAIRILNARVKRLHIGTHSHQIEKDLRVLLKRNGWKLLRDYPCSRSNNTEYGKIKFVDGVQSWVNPRLN